MMQEYTHLEKDIRNSLLEFDTVREFFSKQYIEKVIQSSFKFKEN